jgi:hypothetical protein
MALGAGVASQAAYTACKPFQIPQVNGVQWFPPWFMRLSGFLAGESGVLRMDLIAEIRFRHLVSNESLAACRSGGGSEFCLGGGENRFSMAICDPAAVRVGEGVDISVPTSAEPPRMALRGA